jgi:hypothetical protein
MKPSLSCFPNQAAERYVFGSLDKQLPVSSMGSGLVFQHCDVEIQDLTPGIVPVTA